ncbi:MAG: hypothetical protein M1823_003490 [Watsoniomyces obsoletus]|nr:MAG: hypothetical protein M1823_003490 [Watsoniomyces obsoletus]
MADQDAMAVDGSISPALRPRGSSSEPINLRRDSMEDADPTLTRKRQRLDDHAAPSRSRSLDPIMQHTINNNNNMAGTEGPPSSSTMASSPSSPPPERMQQKEAQEPASSSSTMRPEQASEHHRTPSKVTINVRARPSDPVDEGSPASPSSPEAVIVISSCESSSQHSSPKANRTTPERSDMGETTTETIIDATETRSSSTTSIRSPEIEVAPVEDMDQDDTTDDWDPLVTVVQPDVRDALIERFPAYAHECDLKQVVGHVAAIMEKGTLTGKFLALLADWFAYCADNIVSQRLQWHALLAAQQPFWEDVTTIIDAFARRRIIFDDPTPRRARPQGDSGNGEANGRPEDVLVQYARLTRNLLDLDIAALEHADGTGDEPTMVSLRFQLTAAWTMMHSAAGDVPLWGVLGRQYAYNIDALNAAVFSAFAAGPIHGVRRLCQFTQLLSNRAVSYPGLAHHVWYPVYLSHRLVVLYIEHAGPAAHRQDTSGNRNFPTHHEDRDALWSPILRDAADIARATDAVLQMAGTKQSLVLTRENLREVAACNGRLMSDIALADPELGLTLLRERTVEIGPLSPEEIAHLLPRVWKINLLRKCVVAGRMEVRVHAIESISTELIEVYKRYHAYTPRHAVMRYLAEFLVRHKLIEYLVGPESHPQLVERSSNIAGFLMVNEQFTHDLSDYIWDQIGAHQDRRFVMAILRMLRGFLNITGLEDLLYFCAKVATVLLPSFDAAMVEYAMGLFQALITKFRDRLQTEPEARLDLTPLRLCMRLLRESCAWPMYPPTNASLIFPFALREMQDLLPYGMTGQDRRAIYQDCLDHLAAKTPMCTGSYFIINSLLNQLSRSRMADEGPEDFDVLTSEHDLTRLVIEETAHTWSNEMIRAYVGYDEVVLTPRLDMLSRIIHRAPTSVTPALSDQLWRCVAENRFFKVSQRDVAWTMMGNVTEKSLTRNPLIDRWVDKYLPRLHPSDYCAGLLNWVTQVVQYEHRMITLAVPGEGEIIELKGAELLWRIILTAPDRTIEQHASHCLVGFYLDTSLIRNAPRSAIEATHLALVDRCVRQLTKAADRLKAFGDGTQSGEDEPMIIIASDAEEQTEELRFTRSLMFLRDFIQGIRERPEYAATAERIPVTAARPTMVHDDHGDSVGIRYQTFPADPTQPALRELEISTVESSHTLRDRLREVTGFDHFRIICSGQELDLDREPTRTVAELSLGTQPLMITKREKPPTRTLHSASNDGLTTVEVELLKHVDDLYDLLGLDEKLASQLWDFLNAIPLRNRPRRQITPDVPLDAVFPAGQPFKTMYSATTMRATLENEMETGRSSAAFMQTCIKLLVAALTSETLLDNVADETLKIRTLATLVACFSEFLTRSTGPVSDLGDESLLVECLLSFCTLSLPPSPLARFEESMLLTCNAFSCIIRACHLSTYFWGAFRGQKDVITIVRRLLLQDRRGRMRSYFGDTIGTMGQATFGSIGETDQDVAIYFWGVLCELLPEITEEEKLQCAELFDAMLKLLPTVSDFLEKGINCRKCFDSWAHLLVKHEHDEVVGRDTVDHFVHGLARLLQRLIKVAQRLEEPLESGYVARLSQYFVPGADPNLSNSNFLATAFTKLLFPELSTWTTEERITERMPIIHSATRKELNDLMLLLCNSREKYENLLHLLTELVPNREFGGVPSASFSSNTRLASAFVSTWNFSQLKAIRSNTGYVGLQNLSNTCYLNSLCTQLFMNLGFRAFMLQANVADPDGSQRLLCETQKLFSYMQNSWQAAVEPKELAGAIKTYDNEHIDVTVQMDVDEFYNLLFDRWEGQILSDQDKKHFRSFYGGQLVQQVKSRECLHISEREEPFSAIQCDIKGKSSLQESLKAYVEGDMMEGDNKYSCTGCGRHVDAVKRTCLKEVPDNLIFHLKRFDFDLRTMQRSKINDYFEFPWTLDMSPYKIEHLSDPQSPTPEDPFELVGVLVHSGTAESGHYYSYIRERSITNPDESTGWVHYNDAEVQYWDPSNMASQCFGGLETWNQARDVQPIVLHKSYNAYMLFYQRASTLQAQREREVSINKTPEDLVALDLANHIALDNELLLRKYCLFDESHAVLVKSAFEMLRQFEPDGCSIDHSIERSVIDMGMSYLDQVMSHTKEVPDFSEMAGLIMGLVRSCPRCCKILLEWFVMKPEATRSLLMRAPPNKVRQETCKMIAGTLQLLRTMDKSLYGLELMEKRQTSIQTTVPFADVLFVLRGFWDNIDTHLRAWDEYFGILTQLIALGGPERMMVLMCGYIRRCLELLLADFDPNLCTKYDRLTRATGKGRKVSFKSLTELLKEMLATIDLTSEDRRKDEDDRYRKDMTELVPLTEGEDMLMRTIYLRHRAFVWLTKLLDTNHNPDATMHIVRQLVLAEPEHDQIGPLCRTLIRGITYEPSAQAEPYLQAALIVCEFAPNPMDTRELISKTSREVDTIGNNGGKEHLHFFRTLSWLKNDRLQDYPDLYRKRIIDSLSYWAPPLLLYWDPEVREGTETLIHQLLFDYGVPPTTEDQEMNACLDALGRTLGWSCINKLIDRFTDKNQHVERKSLESIGRVMGECTAYFVEHDDYHDFLARREEIMSQLSELVVEEGEEVGSDEWDDGSNAESGSSDVEVALLTGSNSP